MSQSHILRNGVRLYPYSQPTSVVGLFVDGDGNWRLHTGGEAGFRGYAYERFGEWTVEAMCAGSGFDFRRAGYKTEAGAVRALERQAEKILQ